ncbi:MAG: amidohydrolase [Alphaproteobacteria bacterium]|nr:amidohydrolase [Alphaproteobacteria bacterium]
MAGLAADLVLTGGRITTLDDGNAEVEALAARDGQIVALGSDAEVSGLIGPETEVIMLEGRRAIPGIVDSHCHPDSQAARLARWHDLGPDSVGSRATLLERIAEAPGEGWFGGYRFDETKSGGYPSLAELDVAGDGRPLFILRTDGHLGLANGAAFEALGIGPETPDPPFGRFDRDPTTGALTGLVRETAAHLFLERLHESDTPADIAAGLEAVFAEFLSHGITTCYNSLAGRRSIQAYQQMRAEGRLPLRVGIIVSGREEGLVESYIAAGIASGFGDDWLRVIGIEWCPDCSTSGRTAAYYEPYVGTAVPGEPDGNTGMLLYEADDLTARALAAHRAGLQVMIEGVGDRGIDFALDVIEACLAAHPVADHRMRVEHCCYVTPAILARLKRLVVIDSSATGFMYDLGHAYRANRGAAAMRGMWPHRDLIDAGVPAPGHSDAYICRPNPFTAIWSMVNRKAEKGNDLDGSQAVTPLEALRAYTVLGAFAGREEAVKGTLELGKLADIVVLDRDLFEIPKEEIREIRVETTIVGGRVRYRRV